MQGTALLYSSHNRSNYIHDELIVQRALRGRENRRILFLPMSETVQRGSELERQEFSWGTFRWFFGFYDRFGLEYFPFFWRSSLHHDDVQKLWHWLYTSEVVILGGGHSATGLHRYKELGARFDGEPGKFGRILHERQDRGLLTVGFSAGADQLAEYRFGRTWDAHADTQGFGLARDVMVTLHHEPYRNGELRHAAGKFGHCMVFGLPNDAGLNVDQGQLPSGNYWQVIEFVVDQSWDDPEDNWHVKTRQGALIEHVYRDGRHWSFRGGDVMVRVRSGDRRFDEAWVTQGGRLFHYGSQQPSRFGSVTEILASH